MNPEMKLQIEQRLKTLQIIIMTAIMSLVAYVGVAFVLIRQGVIEPTAIPTLRNCLIVMITTATVSSSATSTPHKLGINIAYA